LVWQTAVTCAVQASIFAPGWKKTLMTAVPFSVVDSIRRMSLTLAERKYSLSVVTRCSISSVAMPR